LINDSLFLVETPHLASQVFVRTNFVRIHKFTFPNTWVYMSEYISLHVRIHKFTCPNTWVNNILVLVMWELKMVKSSCTCRTIHIWAIFVG
jgi:hypothetical protein